MLKWIIGGLLALVGVAALLVAGGYFALKRPDVAYESLAARYENAASRYVDLPGGVHMHYRDEGLQVGPTLLLIHGYSASLHTWEPWVARLGDTYRIVSIDLPGHGLTRAPAGYQASIEGFRDAVDQFVRAQNLQRFAIAGNSMGGNVAWEYTLAHPERVEALILVDSSGWQDGGRAENATFRLLRNPILGPLLRDLDNTRLVRGGLTPAFADASLVTDDMVTRYVELSRAPGHRDILLQLMLGYNERNYATPERLAPLAQTPVLILWGDTDRLIPPAHAEHFANAISGSESVMFERVGHIPQEEAADASAQAAREFLNHVHTGVALATAAQ